MPPPTDVDLTVLVYLNPELPAYSNIRTVEQAFLAYDSLGPLPERMPQLPRGFDSRVFLAAQPDISILNRTVTDAMLGEGMSSAAVARRGVYVGTLLDKLVLTAPNAFRSTVPLTPGLLQVGDAVKVTRTRGDALTATVTSVTYPYYLALSNPVCTFADPNAGYSIFGIRIADPERQARVAYARSNLALQPVAPDDLVVRQDFDVDMYHLLYPDTRGFSTPDTYIDYRTRWKRQDEYRVVKGGDIYNLSAPYSSNMPSSAATAGSDFTVLGNLIAAGCNMYVSSSNVVINSNLEAGSGFLVVTPVDLAVGGSLLTVSANGIVQMAASNMLVSASNVYIGGRSNLVVSPQGVTMANSNLVVTYDAVTSGYGNLQVSASNATFAAGDVSLLMSLCVGGTVGFGMSNPGACNARLAVDGNIFTTGTLITLSDERAKSEITRIQDGLRRLCSMTGYTYVTNSTPRRRHVGLLAQEVEAAIPEAVYTINDNYKSVAYGNLMGLVVEAIKELTGRIEALEGCANK
jgi:hypothetical protein